MGEYCVCLCIMDNDNWEKECEGKISIFCGVDKNALIIELNLKRDNQWRNALYCMLSDFNQYRGKWILYF